jgi:hypothetical protein
VSAVARFFIAISLCLVAAVAVADAAPVAGDAASIRPNAGGDPDVITVRLGVLDIAEIIDREQVYVADLFVEVE